MGMLFVPSSRVADARAAIEASIGRSKLRLSGWRRVPVNPNSLGQRAFETMPEIWQFFIGPVSQKTDRNSAAKFERSLWLLRKRAESLLPERCYICSLSSRTIVYKGLLTPWQFPRYYEDLRSSDFTAKFAIFHQRYSTNTQPSWQLAQPFRYIAHNGEINTVISNRRWLRALERDIRKRIGVGKWFHLLEENVSDSASFDNALEIKLLEGKSVEAAMLALVPPAFLDDPFLSSDVQAALEILSRDGAPWDGPAALVFSDGHRWARSSTGMACGRCATPSPTMAWSSQGRRPGLSTLKKAALPNGIRLGPGEMILVHPSKGVLLRWREVLKTVAQAISAQNRRTTQTRGTETSAPRPQSNPRAALPRASGWSDDQYKILFRPLLRARKRTGAWATMRHRRFFRPSASAVGLLQAAVCPGHQSADRSAARIARHVARCAARSRAISHFADSQRCRTGRSSANRSPRSKRWISAFPPKTESRVHAAASLSVKLPL